MSGFVGWIAAQSDELRPRPITGHDAKDVPFENDRMRRKLPRLDHADGISLAAEPRLEYEHECDPGLHFYRRRTIALLHRYERFSLETGRLPSIMGSEFFRTTVTSYRSVTFEDRVIFVRDVEKVLSRLDYWDQQLVARAILQEHNYEKAAYLLHCSRKTIQRRVPEVLDLLSEYFLEVGLLVAISAEH
jgi:hypothetical protein